MLWLLTNEVVVMEEMRVKFETWVLKQFGKDKVCLLSKVGGIYADSDINTMWISFNAGAQSVNW